MPTDSDTLIAAIEFGKMARVEKHRGDAVYTLFTKDWPPIQRTNIYQVMEELAKAIGRPTVWQYSMLLTLADYEP